MRDGETTPLLPPRSQRRAKAKHQRDVNDPKQRVGSYGSGNNAHASENDEDSDDSSDSDDEEEQDEYSEDGLHHHWRHSKPFFGANSTLPVIHPLGVATRKPRWTGIRSKIAAVPGSSGNQREELQPRANARRGRFRSSDYDEQVAIDHALQEPPTEMQSGRVAAYCTSEQVALFKLLKWLDKLVREKPAEGKALPIHVFGWENKMYMGVVHSSSKCVSSDDSSNQPSNADLLKQKHAFYFATGCCVFWGLTREEEMRHLQALTPFTTGIVPHIEAEDMTYGFGDSSYVANDAIVLSSNAVAEKLAISFAMAQSAKLDVFEERVDDRIRTTKHIPSNLATTGSIQYSQEDISKLIGQLFIELADVNLHSDILDEPDFFWEDDEFEPLYKRTLKYLDVANRVKILNKRLDILRELVQVLNQELTQQHGAKLEWIIIWLLVIEIVISVGWNMILKDILGLFNH